MQNRESECAKRLAAMLHKQAGPYLFVGAGMSIRYAGLPGWKNLLREFADHTDRPIEYYVAGADGDLAKAATSIAVHFWSEWWQSDLFKESRKCYSKSLRVKSSPLKIEISKFLLSRVASFAVPNDIREEYDAFSRIEIDAIITTNFDNLLSTLFPSFRVFVGQDELLLENPQGVAEIYHIHGSVLDPDSLVLTDEDYAGFNERNPYLAAKLITIFAEHPIIFLGYSLSDPNIAQILHAVVHGFRSENAGRLREKIIFVDWVEGCQPGILDSEIVIDGLRVPVTRITTDSYLWVFQVLANRQRALPAWLLRKLKEQVYDLVKKDDPRRQLMYVKDIADTPDGSTFDVSTIDVVFGVGARVLKKGLVGLSRWDLVDDLLDDPRLNLDPVQVLGEVIPRLVPSTYVPIFKYLRSAELLNNLRSGDVSNIDSRVVTRFKKYSGYFENLPQSGGLVSLAQLVGSHDDKWISKNAMDLPKYTDDVEGVRSFLIANREWKDDTWLRVQYGKLAVVYDWLRFGLP